ncbi:MAG TPA: hypothetical protein VL860_03085 [Planctomycetota bacterium]|nr:hypothetical protein [Planctomycetota bacterium]
MAGNPPLSGSSPEDAAENAEHLRQKLFARAALGATPELLEFCRRHQTAIHDNAEAWRVAPKEIRTDPAAMQAYVNALVTVATVFADQLNDPSLLQALQGPGGGPLSAPQKLLEEARGNLEADEPAAALDKLERIPIMLENFSGPPVEFLHAITLGTLGLAHFQYGQLAKARPLMLETLRRCEAADDLDGQIVWHHNLFEFHRYAGETAHAVSHARQAATLMAKSTDSAAEAPRWRKRADLLAAGEPLLRVLAQTPAGLFELDELPSLAAQPEAGKQGVQFLFERNRMALAGSTRKVEKGKTLGAQGHLREALEQFQAAAAIDPFDPDPSYQIGATCLHLKQYAESADAFQRTEKLAPGWFDCRANRWLAVQLMRGSISADGMPNLWTLECGEPDPARAEQRARELLQQYPDLALAYFHLSKSFSARQKIPEALAAAETGLAKATLAGEPDLQTRLLVQLAALLHPDTPRRRELLNTAIKLEGNRVAAAGARLILALAP